MSHSELIEWGEYLSNNPSIQELQMARLMHITAATNSVKGTEVSDYLVTRKRYERREPTVEEINQIAGVA